MYDIDQYISFCILFSFEVMYKHIYPFPIFEDYIHIL